MNTVLIAEDEKLIRLGLKTMAQRSGVPIGEILEARDGEEALCVLKERAVDLLITDIRMPRMDGITLAEQLQSLPHPPMVLVVSGYEDFNYAVSMLRFGVSDYLLKPVERQRFCEALTKLEAQYQEQQKTLSRSRHQYLRALRRLMLERTADSRETDELTARYEGIFFPGPYVGFCAEVSAEALPEDVICLRTEGKCMLVLAEESRRAELQMLLPPPIGCSRPHTGLSQLRLCYLEAHRCWQRAFFTAGTVEETRPAKTDTPSVTPEQLLGLVSLSRNKEILTLLETQAHMVAQGDLAPEAFDKLCAEFVRGLCAAYKNLIDPADDPIRFAQIWDFGSEKLYLDALGSWLTGFCGRISQEFADYENKRKIRQAVQYIQENFRSSLNMAVVSNQVSMNYSLFSLLFKQYTGTNFVNYLQSLRIEETKRLLSTTDWRVSEIGRRAGFTDDKHFLKVFKNATGLSPSEYRKTQSFQSAIQTDLS